jgi:hypothetical protein
MCKKRLIQGTMLFAAVVTMVPACNTPSTPLQSAGAVTTETVSLTAAGAQVSLVSATKDRLSGTVHVLLEVTNATGEVDTHQLELRGNDPRDQRIGAAARLLSPWGETEFEVGVAWSPEESTTQFWERSKVDELDFVIHKNSEEVTETYTLNGEFQTIRYPESTAMDFEDALYRVRTGDASSDVALDQALVQFDRLYSKQHTLDNNRHGELLVAIVTNPQFTEWLEGFIYPDGRDTYSTIGRDKLCLIASACAATKCMAGGMANPLCTACGGVSIACVIADLALWAFGEE